MSMKQSCGVRKPRNVPSLPGGAGNAGLSAPFKAPSLGRRTMESLNSVLGSTREAFFLFTPAGQLWKASPAGLELLRGSQVIIPGDTLEGYFVQKIASDLHVGCVRHLGGNRFACPIEKFGYALLCCADSIAASRW
jgi:hypothetical protein